MCCMPKNCLSNHVKKQHINNQNNYKIHVQKCCWKNFVRRLWIAITRAPANMHVHIESRTYIRTYCMKRGDRRLETVCTHLFYSWSCVWWRRSLIAECSKSPSIDRRTSVCKCVCERAYSVWVLWVAHESIQIHSQSRTLVDANSLLVVQLYMRSHRFFFD